MHEIIEVTDLKKSFKVNKRAKGLPGRIANLFVPKYEIRQAVSGISFSIKEGDSVGFIGPNGAGKSTTIKMLSGILYPDSGGIIVDGFVPYKQRREYVSRIGVVFGQKSQLQWDLPIVDSFELLKHIYKIPANTYQANLARFTKLLELEPFLNQPVRQLSLGQRMRADIAAALLHSPKIVFFDEPTIGLDVLAKERIREFVRYMNRELGVTILFTTHDMQDIAETCERLILIDRGEKLYDGSVADMIRTYSSERRLIVTFDHEVSINPMPDVQISDRDGYKKEFLISQNVSLPALIANLSSDYNVVDLTVQDMGIDRIVRQIYEGRIRLK